MPLSLGTYARLESRESDAFSESQEAIIHLQPTKTSQNEIDNEVLPQFETSLGTRKLCMAVLVFSLFVALGCFGFSIAMFVKDPSSRTLIRYTGISKFAAKVVSLVTVAGLTLCFDQVSYIHSTSLRWSLYREHRLEFNTNIRLFTSSKTYGPNSWWVNMISLACLIISYAGSSQIFILEGDFGTSLFNVAAILAVGFGMLGQCIIGIICLLYSKDISTWSSNPLNTTLAARHGHTQRALGRCMLSVHDSGTESIPSLPRARQGSMLKANKLVGRIVSLIWIVGLLSLIPVLATAAAVHWGLVIETGFYLSGSQTASTWSIGLQCFVALLLFCGIQGLQTTALHCAELIINMSRDERIWRRASTKRGAPVTFGTFGPLTTAIASWETILLFIFKALLHWTFGGTIALNFTRSKRDGPIGLGFKVSPVMGIMYAGFAICLAIFVTILAQKRPKGPQPAAHGHIQTLADLVDDWTTDSKGKFWWGDKTRAAAVDVRHAGTSPIRDEMTKVRMYEMYSGKAMA